MNADDVIRQIKANTRFFLHDGAPQVAGAAEATQAIDKAWLHRPAAYVIALEDEPEPNVSLNGLDQVVTESIAVIVDLSNRADQRGQEASSTVADARADLFTCLLNWWPDGANAIQGMSYAGGHLVQMDRERLHWQFRFSLKIQITDADGYQPPGDPVTDIHATLTNPDTLAPTPIAFDIRPET